MEEMISARYNVWWYLSFIVPALIMIAGTYRRNRVILVIAVIISLFTTYALCNLSVRKKWHKRYEIAKTQEEMDYATTDGANLVFTAIFIGPFEAILYTFLWGFVGYKLWPKVLKRKNIITSGSR
jgi:hypothetical protein